MQTFKLKHIIYILLSTVMLFVTGCDLKNRINLDDDDEKEIRIRRYDRLESRYLTTGDFSALQQMSTEYPIETRTLVEDVLQIGKVTESDINSRFLQFFQDTLLQELISDSEAKFADMRSLNKEFNRVFTKIRTDFPMVEMPDIYAQIGGLNQSIVVNNKSIGICIDKYLGSDYHIYKRFYSESQIKDMKREFIVPDAVMFYLISIFPMPDYNDRKQIERDLYMGKIMWVTNYYTDKKFYNTTYVRMVNNYMHKYKNININTLLENNDYEEIIKTNRE